ncbi:MAG: N-acetylmuramoyl-L-alanine amidase [Burkholderiales bacterium]|nr:N-acetylmuramoyl-L-alanine amidase [Burkholderiales bacterium]MBP9768688.1 N-acetylmuramoyl-L-alanine amidase [Burkholderiales bacterium]
MSYEIDQQRRNLIKFGMFSGLTLLISSKKSAADNLIDQFANDSTNQIISVRIWPSDVYTRLTIEAEQGIKAKFFNLANPNRFVIDILNSTLNTVLKNLSNNEFSNDPIISGIKVGQFNPTTVRIVIYAKQPVSAQTQTIDPVHLGSVNYKYRYVFDMYPANAITNHDESSPLNDQLLAFLQLNADQDKPGVESSAKSTIAKRSQDYPEISEPNSNPQVEPQKGKLLVMIDPGHGGEDPGAIGAQGTKEKHVVLDIGKRLRDLINASSNMQAQMTRTQDIFIPLGTRVAIARKVKADIFVSVHADAFTSPAARGSSVFVLSDSGASSAFAKYMAVSQNNSDLIGGMSFQTRDSAVSRILLDMTQSFTMRKSTKLAQSILAQLKQINKLHNQDIERAGFAVLKAPDIPSILVESAFVSNPIEENLLRTEEFRQKVAQQVFDGLQNYAKTNYKLA